MDHEILVYDCTCTQSADLDLAGIPARILHDNGATLVLEFIDASRLEVSRQHLVELPPERICVE